MIAVVVGLEREARIAAGGGVRVLACGGRADTVRHSLEAACTDETAGIISFGICGALQPGLRPGTSIIASEIIAAPGRIATDAPWSARLRQQLPDSVCGGIAGTDVILRNGHEKSLLSGRTGAIGADMESWPAAEFARDHGLPFACLRVVADSAATTVPAAALNAMRPDGSIDMGAVLRSITRNPAQIPPLIRLARETNRAFAALLRCRRVLGSGFAGPDLRQPALDMV